jgi:hypothetical protein
MIRQQADYHYGTHDLNFNKDGMLHKKKKITQIKMCLPSINHKDEQISLLYINITEECTYALPVSDDHRSCQKLI